MSDEHSKPTGATVRHAMTRMRHEIKVRELRVQRVERLTPHMVRVVLTGEALAGFSSAASDDHVRVFFPDATGHLLLPSGPPGGGQGGGGHGRHGGHGERGGRAEQGAQGESGRPPMRDYTPRHYDPQAQELWLDFVLHGEGPAASWAARARAGDRLGVGGPRGSFVVADDFDWYLLIGDETGLPAIARRIEETRHAAHIHVIVEVENAAEQLALPAHPHLTVQWVHRRAAAPGEAAPLLEAVGGFSQPPGDGYVWVAAESHVARTLREALVARGFPKDFIKAAGYWKRGATATHEVHND